MQTGLNYLFYGVRSIDILDRPWYCLVHKIENSAILNIWLDLNNFSAFKAIFPEFWPILGEKQLAGKT